MRGEFFKYKIVFNIGILWIKWWLKWRSNWLLPEQSFYITTPNGNFIHYVGPINFFTGSIILEPEETIQVTYNLLEEDFGNQPCPPYYDFTNQGTYMIIGIYTSFSTDGSAMNITLISNTGKFIINS